MIKIPYEEILAKIVEKTSLPQSAIEEKIKDKLNQFSGLISKEGAAHIVANEFGVRIIETPVSGRLAIKNILAGMRSVDTVGRIVNMSDVRSFQKDDRVGSVASMIIGDETSTIRVVAWGEQTKRWREMKPGDIVKVVGGYTKENNEQKELHINDRTRLIINPPDEKVGDVPQQQTQRRPIADLKLDDANVELHGVVVQAFEPRFFEVCGKCGKRIRGVDGAFTCPTHGAVPPDFSYVASIVLDDGTETIRVSCFRQQVEQLFGKSTEDMMRLRESPEALAGLKQSVVGKLMTFAGRARKNDVLDRVEFVAQSVNPSPDPEQELRRMMS